MSDTTNTSTEERTADGSAPAELFTSDQQALIAAANKERDERNGITTTNTAPEPETEAAAAAAPVDEAKPFPAKFLKADGTKDYDALEAAYAELEKKLGAGAAKTEEKAATEDEPADPTLKIEAKAEDKGEEKAAEAEGEVVEKVGDVVVTEEHRTIWTGHLEAFQKDGKLSDEAYAFAKEQFGVTDKSMVDSYARGQIAEATLSANTFNAEARADALTVIGGEDSFTQLSNWAAENLSAEEVTDLNTSLASQSIKEVKLALSNLKLRYDSDNPKAPNPIVPSSVEVRGETYATTAEMTRAMNKLDADGRRLYDIDPAYRAKVEATIDRSAPTMR